MKQQSLAVCVIGIKWNNKWSWFEEVFKLSLMVCVFVLNELMNDFDPSRNEEFELSLTVYLY